MKNYNSSQVHEYSNDVSLSHYASSLHTMYTDICIETAFIKAAVTCEDTPCGGVRAQPRAVGRLGPRSRLV